MGRDCLNDLDFLQLFIDEVTKEQELLTTSCPATLLLSPSKARAKTTADGGRTTTRSVAPPDSLKLILSPSQGRAKTKKAADFRTRHWSYLFETLRRTVDAIYETCRTDRSVIECKVRDADSAGCFNCAG